MKFPSTPFHPLKTVQESVEELKKKDTPLLDAPRIPEFYAGQEIFITGGSGFIGKVLIEKLLRSCPDVKAIYALMRPKKGRSVEERLNDITDIPLFDALRDIFPKFQEKLFAIVGDVAELKLGMSKEDIDRMKNVSIIFHSAASVRFDDSLKHAILMNTRGTREVMEFATNLQHLKVVMHVSTSFSNVYVHVVEEKIYPAAADWRKTIEICEKMDESQLDNFTQHYIGFMPNTYVFSKNLAEHVSEEYKQKLPVVLFRPSIVIGTFREPIPGWVDNLNGPMGILLASVLGISRTMYCDSENRMDIIPVDVCAKSMIIAAWKAANKTSNSLQVYNCTAGKKMQMTIQQMLDIGIHGVCQETAMEHMIWLADGGVTLNKTYNFVCAIFFQIMPAIVLDFGLKFQKQKPRLMSIQRKMYEANKALSYFVTHDWEFKNDNFVDLCRYLKLEDVKDWEYRDMFTFDLLLALRNTLMGYRRYLLKEKDESLPKCRKRYAKFVIANGVIQSIPYFVAFYICFLKYDVMSSTRGFLGF